METKIHSSREFVWYTPGEHPIIGSKTVHATALSLRAGYGEGCMPPEFIVKSERTGELVTFELEEKNAEYAGGTSCVTFYVAFSGAVVALSPRYLRIAVLE